MLSEANLIVLFIRPLVDYFQYLLGNGQRILFSVFFRLLLLSLLFCYVNYQENKSINFYRSSPKYSTKDTDQQQQKTAPLETIFPN